MQFYLLTSYLLILEKKFTKYSVLKQIFNSPQNFISSKMSPYGVFNWSKPANWLLGSLLFTVIPKDLAIQILCIATSYLFAN